MVLVEAFYYLLVRFVGKGEDMRKAWWTTLGSQELGELLSVSLPHYPATIMQENAIVFCGLLNAEEDYVCIYVYVCIKFAHFKYCYQLLSWICFFGFFLYINGNDKWKLFKIMKILCNFLYIKKYYKVSYKIWNIKPVNYKDMIKIFYYSVFILSYLRWSLNLDLKD